MRALHCDGCNPLVLAKLEYILNRSSKEYAEHILLFQLNFSDDAFIYGTLGNALFFGTSRLSCLIFISYAIFLSRNVN